MRFINSFQVINPVQSSCVLLQITGDSLKYHAIKRASTGGKKKKKTDVQLSWERSGVLKLSKSLPAVFQKVV